jgi:hypothetical protein
MNHLASISTAPTTQPVQSAQAQRPMAVWVLAAVFIFIAIFIAIAVFVADGSLTPVQRIAVFMQTGMFP